MTIEIVDFPIKKWWIFHHRNSGFFRIFSLEMVIFHSYVLNHTRIFCHPKCLDNAIAPAAGTKSFSPRSLPHDTNGPFFYARLGWVFP